MSYLIDKFKGIYRLKVPIDRSTNDFPRKPNGQYEDIDVYIDCQYGNQIFHCDRADASAVRTRCCCDNHRHRHGILQSVIYRMRYYLRCFICTYFPVPAARF